MDIITAHFHQYPAMQPTDAVKLLFQNEFACGHMLPSEAECAARVDAERETLQPGVQPTVVKIGNGLCRLDLRGVSPLPAVRVARMMRRTARESRGTLKSFERKLDTLRALTQSGSAPFSCAALDAYLAGYAAQGYPPVSHSADYRRAYQPAYRVVLRGYADALPLMLRVESALTREGRALLVLDGDCGAGKTAMASLLSELYDCTVVHMDDFFLPPQLRTAERLDEPGGNLHRERFLSEVLRGLLSGAAFTYGRYACHTGETSLCEVAPRPVTIIEGSYSLHPAFDESYAALHAIRCLLRVPPEEQLRRLRKRGSNTETFAQRWIPLEKKYFEAYHRERGNELSLCCKAWEEDAP